MVKTMVTYKQYPQSNLINDWDKLIKLTTEEVADIHAEWVKIDKENSELNTEAFHTRNAKVKEAVDYMQSIGIDVHKYKKSGFMPVKNGYSAWFNTNVATKIHEQYPYCNRSMPTAHSRALELDGVRLSNNKSPTQLTELHSNLVAQYKHKMNELNKANKLLIKSIEYATQHSIDIEDLDTKSIIRTVEEHAIETYREEHLPDGTEIRLKSECYDCNVFIVGNHRCECGNRRIGVTVEGNILDGFYHYSEAN